MSITGNGSLSLRKKDLKESNSIAVGFKRLVFAHKATAGQTGINLASLTTPTEMSSQGFVNATLNDITTSNLLFFRNNLTLMSSAKGRLVDYLSYSVSSGTQINFNGFTADEGEIFVGIIDNDAKTGLNIVDARPISATGLLTAGTTDFNVGTPFEVGKYITSQVGAVIVFRNGQVQFRNAANSASSTDGNYYEVDPGGGLGTVIRFNTAAGTQDDNILVVSNGLVAERPTGSMMATIENINGQLNNMAGYVADAVGSTSAIVLGAAPSNVDLKAFGDTVYSQGNRITTLETTVPTVQRFLSGSGTYSLPTGCKWIRVRMVGGGGGGGGGSTASNGSAGTGGGTTTFGTSFLTCTGGGGGAQGNTAGSQPAGGNGGTATIGAGATGIAMTGNGGGSGINMIVNQYAWSGQGGAGPWGGGAVGNFATGTSGAANSGAGGNGGGNISGTASQSGGGGGAGGYIDAVIASPLGSYAYSVGTGGGGGAGAGAGSNSGGGGGTGFIIVEEFYK